MEALKKLRDAMGISQAEMAGLLGLKKCRVAMAETGKRTLPDEARMMVAWMLDELETWPALPDVERPPLEVVQQEIRRLEIRLGFMEAGLEDRQQADRRAGFRMFICREFENRFPGRLPALATDTVAVLKSVEALRRNDGMAQDPIFLRAKIKGLQATIAFLKTE